MPRTQCLFRCRGCEQSGQPNAPRENQRAGGMCTAVCEADTRPRATMMDAEARRARMRKVCQTCKLETTQAGSATRSQRSIDDDENEDRCKGSGCRRTLRRRLSWNERRELIEPAIGSRWAAAAKPPVTSSLELDVEASGRATQRATWDLCVASYLLACRQVVEANCNYAPREADPQRQRKLPASSRRVKQLQRCSVTRALRQPHKGGRTSHTRLRR